MNKEVNLKVNFITFYKFYVTGLRQMEDSLIEKRIDKLEARDTKNTEDIIRIDERLNGVGINLDNLKKDNEKNFTLLNANVSEIKNGMSELKDDFKDLNNKVDNKVADINNKLVQYCEVSTALKNKLDEDNNKPRETINKVKTTIIGVIVTTVTGGVLGILYTLVKLAIKLK